MAVFGGIVAGSLGGPNAINVSCLVVIEIFLLATRNLSERFRYCSEVLPLVIEIFRDRSNSSSVRISGELKLEILSSSALSEQLENCCKGN